MLLHCKVMLIVPDVGIHIFRTCIIYVTLPPSIGTRFWLTTLPAIAVALIAIAVIAVPFTGYYTTQQGKSH